MPIYKSANKIMPIYKGDTRIAKAYLGSQLVYRTNSINPAGTVVHSFGVPGSGNFNCQSSGYYLVELAGGGGGGYYYQDYDNPANDVKLGGGGGGYLAFVTWLAKGQYAYTIGSAGTYGEGDIDGKYIAATGGSATIFLGQRANGGLGYSGTPRPTVNSLNGGGTGFNKPGLPEGIGYISASQSGTASSGGLYGTCAFQLDSYAVGRGGGWDSSDTSYKAPFDGYIRITATNWNPPT